MKKVKLKYGKTELEIELPKHAEILTPKFKPKKQDEFEILNNALDNPIDSPRLENFIQNDDRV